MYHPTRRQRNKQTFANVDSPLLCAECAGCYYDSPTVEVDFLVNHLYPTVHPVYPNLNFLGLDHNK